MKIEGVSVLQVASVRCGLVFKAHGLLHPILGLTNSRLESDKEEDKELRVAG